MIAYGQRNCINANSSRFINFAYNKYYNTPEIKQFAGSSSGLICIRFDKNAWIMFYQNPGIEILRLIALLALAEK